MRLSRGYATAFPRLPAGVRRAAAAGTLPSLVRRRAQGQADAGHDGVPRALLALGIIDLEAAQAALGRRREIAAAVEDGAVVHPRGHEETRRGPHIGEAPFAIPSDTGEIPGRRVAGLVARREDADAGAAVGCRERDTPASLLGCLQREDLPREIERHAELAVVIAAPAAGALFGRSPVAPGPGKQGHQHEAGAADRADVLTGEGSHHAHQTVGKSVTGRPRPTMQ